MKTSKLQQIKLERFINRLFDKANKGSFFARMRLKYEFGEDCDVVDGQDDDFVQRGAQPFK